jgi:hypothetical protein
LSEWKLLPGKKPMKGPPPWYDLAYLFEACPGCGASRHEVDWPFQTGYDLPCKQLDGFVGQENRSDQAEAIRGDCDAGSAASKCEVSRPLSTPGHVEAANPSQHSQTEKASRSFFDGEIEIAPRLSFDD